MSSGGARQRSGRRRPQRAGASGEGGAGALGVGRRLLAGGPPPHRRSHAATPPPLPFLAVRRHRGRQRERSSVKSKVNQKKQQKNTWKGFLGCKPESEQVQQRQKSPPMMHLQYGGGSPQITKLMRD